MTSGTRSYNSLAEAKAHGDAILAERLSLEARQIVDLTAANDIDASKNRCKTLYGFVEEAWHLLEPNQPFIGGWAVKAICDHLEAVTDGRIKRLLINIPPGFAKSLIVAVFWPAWEWGPFGRPDMRYLTCSYELDLAIRDNTRMRRLVSSDWYQARWGDLVTFARDQNAKTKFENTATGGREARAFGSLTGGRGNRLIVDDPHSTTTAESIIERGKTIQNFLEGAPHRVNNPEKDAIIVIMQRLHELDLSGAILSRGLGYVHLCLPMHFEIERRCETIIGFRDPRSYEGELLAPERMGDEAVVLLEQSLGTFAIAGQMQQRPSAREGNLFKPDMIEIVEALPATIVKRARGWDLAATKYTPGKDPDWTRWVKIERDADGFFYITGLVSARENATMVETIIKNTTIRDGPNCRVRLPQDPGQAGKGQAAAFARLLAGYPLTILQPTGDKESRASPFAAQVNIGNVRMLKGDWNDAVIEELRTFPAGAHDDIVDAASDAFAEVAESRSFEGMAEFYRQEAVKAAMERDGLKLLVAEVDMWLIKPAPGFSTAYGQDGTKYVTNERGIMVVHPEDGPALLRQMGWSRVMGEQAA